MRPQGSFFFLDNRTANILWLGLLGLVIIFFFALIIEALPIETRLRAEIERRLVDTGYNRTRVELSGRDAVLVGAVSSDQAAKRARYIVSNVKGVRTVRSALQIVPLRLSHVLIKKADDGVLTASGELSSVQQVDVLNTYLAQFSGSDGLKGGALDVRLDPEVTEAEWMELVPDALAAVMDIAGLEIEIGAYLISVAGAVSSRSHYVEAVARLNRLAAAQSLKLVNRLAIIPD